MALRPLQPSSIRATDPAQQVAPAALRIVAIALLAMAAMPGSAAPANTRAVAVSPAPDSVAISIYRAPDRAADSPMQLGWLRGYALTTKCGYLYPAGDADIRFEGGAGGIP